MTRPRSVFDSFPDRIEERMEGLSEAMRWVETALTVTCWVMIAGLVVSAALVAARMIAEGQ